MVDKTVILRTKERMNKKKIVVTPGDGIGPEVTEQALIILKEVATRFQLELEIEEMPVGLSLIHI